MDDKRELASSIGQVEKPGGFFRHQGALGGVFYCLGLLPLLGQDGSGMVLVLSAICTKISKHFYVDMHR